MPEWRLRDLRGGLVSMIFQEPMTALDPVYTIGAQIGETVRRHTGVGRAAARARALELLDLVRIPSPERRLDAYPHELSGGLRQRAMIAMALSCNPRLLARRRADDRARRDRAGAGADPAAPAAARAGHGHDLRDARSRRRFRDRRPDRGHVCRPHRRERPGGGGIAGAGAPVHRRAARLDRARPETRPRHRGHSRQPARYAASLAGLRLRAALRQADAGMPRRRAGAAFSRAGADGGLPRRARTAPGYGRGAAVRRRARRCRARIGMSRCR